MSAFLCSNEHINLLVSYGIDCGAFSLDDAPTVMKAFAIQNVRNLVSLYGRRAEDEAREADSYEFYRIKPRDALQRAGCDKTRAANDLATAVLKQCKAFSYQCCDHDGWEASVAAALLDRIESYAARNGAKDHGPAYDAAPWCI
jgi:hypothetical protein